MNVIKVKIIGNEDNKDKAFGIIRNHNESVICLKDEVYIISNSLKALLDNNNIKYKQEAQKCV